jgi:hypothetical protein
VTTHPCPVDGCGQPVDPEKLVCPAHWRMLPWRLRRAVFASYGDPHRLGDWVRAAKAAIAWIEQREQLDRWKARRSARARKNGQR